MVYIHEHPSDNTVESRNKWGKNLAKLATTMNTGSNSRYETYYGYAGDLTPHNPQPLGDFLTTDDVLKAMMASYDTDINTILLHEDISVNYFGDDISVKNALKYIINCEVKQAKTFKRDMWV